MPSSDTHKPKLISEDMKKEVGLTAVEGNTAPQMKSNIDKKINAAEILTEVQQKLDARKPLTEIEANHAESVEHKALGHRPRADSVAAQVKSYVAKQGEFAEATVHIDDAKDNASKNDITHNEIPKDHSPNAAAPDHRTQHDESYKKEIQDSLVETFEEVNITDSEETQKTQSQITTGHQNDPSGTSENTDPAPKTETAPEKSHVGAKPERKPKADDDVDSIQKYHADMAKNTEQKLVDTNTDA